MIKIIKYNERDPFKKDFKKLKKRFKTLDEDFRISKTNAIELFHLHGVNNEGVVLIPGFESEKFKIYKMLKFACKSLKGRGVKSGVRVIYAYCLESESVNFIEMCFKGDKEKEDKDRITSFLEDPGPLD